MSAYSYISPGNGYGKSNLNDSPASTAPGTGSFSGLGSINPYEDPTFGAYMRGLGVSDNNTQAEIALRNNQLTQQQQSQAPSFAEQLTNGERQIGGNFEDRGVFNSGRRVADQTQFAGDVANQKNQFNQGIQGQRDDLQFQLASQIAANQQNGAEKALQSQQNIALMNAQAGLYK